jgi:hypothetical protein
MTRPFRKLLLACLLLTFSVLLTPRAQATGNCCVNCHTGWQFCYTDCYGSYPDPTACLADCDTRYQSCGDACWRWNEECFIWLPINPYP